MPPYWGVECEEKEINETITKVERFILSSWVNFTESNYDITMINVSDVFVRVCVFFSNVHIQFRSEMLVSLWKLSRAYNGGIVDF